MPDGLKLAQLSTLLAQMGQGAATYSPSQSTMMKGLIGSGQSAITAEAQKKAEKKKKKNKGIFGTAGTVAALAAAPFTGGASLAYLPVAAGAGGAIDSAIAGDGAGVVSNATDAGLGYMAASSMKAKDNTNTPTLDIPKYTGEAMDETDPSFGAKSMPGPVKATTGTPDPNVNPTVKVTPLAPPAVTPAPAAATTGGGKAAPVGPMSTNFNAPAAALLGFGSYAANQLMADNRARTKPNGVPGHSAPTAVGMSPREIRALTPLQKLAMRPTANPSLGGGPYTVDEARALGLTPEEIEDLRARGQIIGTDSRRDSMRKGLTGALIGGMINS